jgi:hypothetical protein
MKLSLSITIAFFTLVFHSLQAQQFEILHVNGILIDKAKQNTIKQGQIVSKSDSIQFKSKYGWAILLQDTSLFFLRLNDPAKPIQLLSEKLEYIKHEPLPTLPIQQNYSNLKNFLKANQFAIIGKTYVLPIDSNEYPIDKTRSLLIRYTYNERKITHQFHTPEGIALNPDALYTYKTEKIPMNKTSEFMLYYYIDQNNESIFISRINPVWINESELLLEMSMLKQAYIQHRIKMDFKIYLQYFIDVYGYTDYRYLEHWLKSKSLL